MAFSEFLEQKREDCRQLVAVLGRTFPYVSILGSDVRSSRILANRAMTDIGEGGNSECGFVLKMHDGRAFFE